MQDDRRVATPPARPLLIFDGDCGFCRFWIARWRRLTGDAVDYEPSQTPDIPERFPEIPRERFAKSVQFVEAGGRVTEGAEAVCRVLAAARRRAPLWSYTHIPGAAATSEAAYRLVASHRPFWSRVTTLLWGRTTGSPTFAKARWLFLRLLGAVYLAAFWSLASQISGLVGPAGILPLDINEGLLFGLCIGGTVLSALLLLGFGSALALPLLWVSYLFVSTVCQEFLAYQWDTLLLEAGFLAVFIAPMVPRERLREATDPPRLGVWLLLWLLFRLMFGSGAMKLASGDSTWRSLAALAFHFETQPLPTPLAWYAHQLPAWFLKGSTAGVLLIELVVPFFILGPRRVRVLAFWLMAGLQALIALTGNYAFFNVLTVGLCLFLLDDASLGRLSKDGGWARASVPITRSRTHPVRRAFLILVAGITLPISAVVFASSLMVDLPGWRYVLPLARLVAPLRSVNSYGLFSVMTTARQEIIVEGSDDGMTWKEYEFKYKPGDVKRRPGWVAPHQPRIDWQMWFAALGRFQSERWFQNASVRLLQGDPAVLKQLAGDPFGGRPPKYLRSLVYRYRFTDWTTGRKNGTWWTREFVGPYAPAISLKPKEGR